MLACAGSPVNVSVVGNGVDVEVGLGVNVGCIGEGVNVGGTDVGAGAHPLTKTVKRTTTMNFDSIELLITSPTFDLMFRITPKGWRLR